MNGSESLLLCESDLRQRMLVCARCAEYKAAPESTASNSNCGRPPTPPPVLPPFMCVFAAILNASDSLFFFFKEPKVTFLWMDNFAKLHTSRRLPVCERANKPLKGYPKRPCLVDCDFRSCHIFSQLRDTTDKPLPLMSPSPASHLALPCVPPVLSSSWVSLRAVCPLPLPRLLTALCSAVASKALAFRILLRLLFFGFLLFSQSHLGHEKDRNSRPPADLNPGLKWVETWLWWLLVAPFFCCTEYDTNEMNELKALWKKSDSKSAVYSPWKT